MRILAPGHRWAVLMLFAGVGIALVSLRTDVLFAAPSSENTRWLVSPEWLKEHLDDNSLIIVDTRSEADYLKGHILGAVCMDAATLAATTCEEGLKVLNQELAERFAPLGFKGGETVVFYEDGIGVRAPRALWYFTYAGYNSGKVLQGGFKTWQEAHFPLSQEKASRKPHPLVVRANPQVIATAEHVAHRLNDPRVVILDVRSRGEYVGKEANTGSMRRGHIPGAHWLEWTQLLYHNSRYLSNEELLKRFSQVGVTP